MGNMSSDKRSFNNNRQQKRDEKNYVTAKLYLQEGIRSDLYNEIISVLRSTQFGKISFPLSVYRADIFDNVEEGDTRVSTAGYINRFDQNKNEFVVVIYNNLAEKINEFEHPCIEVVFTTRKTGELGVITKLVIIDTEVEDDEESDSETEENINEAVENGDAEEESSDYHMYE